jgi:hypothetical protein
MDATPIDDHHDLFASFAKDAHDLMHILAEFLGIKMGHDLIKDARCPILDRANHTEQYPAGHTAPTPGAQPRLAFAALFVFDLTLGQRARWEAVTPGCTPPAGPREGKAPQNGFIFIEQNDLATAGSVLQGREFKMGEGESRWVRIEPSRGAAVADVFFLIPRERSRGSAGCRFGGSRRWRVRDNSTGSGWSRVGAGLGRQGD